MATWALLDSLEDSPEVPEIARENPPSVYSFFPTFWSRRNKKLVVIEIFNVAEGFNSEYLGLKLGMQVQ